MKDSSNTMDGVAEWTAFAQERLSRCVLRPSRFLLLVALSAMVGCGGGPKHELVAVSGLVTLDGVPLKDARVTFSPIGSGVGTASSGRTDSEGRYELSTMDKGLKGTTAGGHRVTVSTVTMPPGADESTKRPPEIVPLRYRNGSFNITVPAEGTDAADIEIQTSKKRRRRR